jgi:hypothetical protein
MAELFGVILKGVTDGGQKVINRLYNDYDRSFESTNPSINMVDNNLKFIVANLADDLVGTPLLSAPHFLMLFASVAHARLEIPAGEMGDAMPQKNPLALSNLYSVRDKLLKLATIIESDKAVVGFEDFWAASKASTQRISSRRVRFPLFYEALAP